MNLDQDQVFDRATEAEAFLKQIANSNRLMILCKLIDGELSVGGLNTHIPLSQSALSQHLAKLREAGLVVTKKESQTVYYQIADPRVIQMIQAIHDAFCSDTKNAG